jgi:hypothetical protein
MRQAGLVAEGASVDPVLARRARIARLVTVGKRVGYGLYGVAIVGFFIGLVAGFGGPIGTTVIACLIVGSVKAAEREDRELGR